MLLDKASGLDVVVAPAAKLALNERLALLKDVQTRLPARESSFLYLLDINSSTAKAAAWARIERRPYVLDIGDETYSLTLSNGGSRWSANVRDQVAQTMLRGARGIVYRGWFHRLILQARGHANELVWIPDTVADSLIDRPAVYDAPSNVICTFGSVNNIEPRATWPNFYGAELLDLLENDHTLRGVVVLRGPGAAPFWLQAAKRNLSKQLDFRAQMSVDDLFGVVQRAAFVTSYQTDDPAGCTRTTGKLPLVLAAGRGLLTTNVGEAYRLLPYDQTYPATRTDFVSRALARLKVGWTPAMVDVARSQAEQFRRSRQAKVLGDWLCDAAGF